MADRAIGYFKPFDGQWMNLVDSRELDVLKFSLQMSSKILVVEENRMDDFIRRILPMVIEVLELKFDNW